ncbi:MAG TPA: hypothetical protein VNJ08_14535 [Bacteriovoracaceae bacterium]|nr:hypothetical protein [Bacteriovoracaceae bacterium]
MHKLLLAALFLSASVQATELDPSTANIPQEIVVREDAQGNREVFKVAPKANVGDADAAVAVVENFVKASNKVSTVVAAGELDRTSSTEAWYYYYNFNVGYNYGYNYSYNWYGSNYNYSPYYSYNYGHYNYYYYRCW